MIVVAGAPAPGWTAMFPIPRNFIKLRIPPDHPAYPLWADGAWGDPSNLAWGVYAYGSANPQLFTGPNTGGYAGKVILGTLLGLDVDYFAMVALQGFADVVDALGGVDITVTTRLYDPAYTYPGEESRVIDFPPGDYHMGG